MKKFLLIIFILIVLPLVGIFLFLRNADFNEYKPQIEALARKYTNLDIKINGDIKVGISLKPSVELNNVDITNLTDKSKIAEIGMAMIQVSVKPLLHKEVVIDTVQTAKTKVYYDKNEYVEINDIVADMEGLDKPINISYDTTVSNIRIYGEGIISSIKEIKAKNYDEISGKIKLNAMGYGVDFDGVVSGLQKDKKVSGKYSISYKTNKATGNVYVSLANVTPYLKLNANADKINVNDFLAKKQAYNWGFVSTAEASELVANTIIPYKYLKLADADVALNIKNLDLNKDIKITNVLSNIKLKNGVFKADIKNITAGNGTITGLISVNSANKSANVNINGKDIILQDFYLPLANSTNDEYIKNGGKSNINISLNTKGINTDEYISNLAGQVIVIVDKSVIKIKSLEALQGNIIMQVLNSVKVNLDNKDLNLSCAVIRGDINGGVVKFPKGIAFNAREFYLVADGVANLNNEKIKFELQPFSGLITDTNVSSVLGGLLRVKGTISNPQLAINKKQTVKNVVGAIASGGVYNAGDMMIKADQSPCYTALKGTSYEKYFKHSGNVVTNNISQTYGDAKVMMKDLGNQAKNFLNGLKKDKKK